jgi:hypothetical protein
MIWKSYNSENTYFVNFLLVRSPKVSQLISYQKAIPPMSELSTTERMTYESKISVAEH